MPARARLVADRSRAFMSTVKKSTKPSRLRSPKSTPMENMRSCQCGVGDGLNRGRPFVETLSQNRSGVWRSLQTYRSGRPSAFTSPKCGQSPVPRRRRQRRLVLIQKGSVRPSRRGEVSGADIDPQHVRFAELDDLAIAAQFEVIGQVRIRRRTSIQRRDDRPAPPAAVQGEPRGLLVENRRGTENRDVEIEVAIAIHVRKGQGSCPSESRRQWCLQCEATVPIIPEPPRSAPSALSRRSRSPSPSTSAKATPVESNAPEGW